MKRILLVIFLLLIPISYLIYNITLNPKKNILVFGDNLLLTIKDKSYLDNFDKDKYNINTFTYDNITYKEMLKKIKSNDYIIIKNKEVYLNQLIAKSKYIIINANNKEYFNKCRKNDSIIKNYNDFINNDINNLENIIKKISTAKIIVIGNYCKTNQKEETKFTLKNKKIGFVDLYNIPNKNTEEYEFQIYKSLNNIINNEN